MELQPSQVVRLVQLGDRRGLLTSGACWSCTSCKTCSTRCPAGVDLAGIQDALRHLHLTSRFEEGAAVHNRSAAFNDAFLATVQRFGRMSELGMMLRFKRHTGRLLEDAGLGLALLRRGKLRLRASRVKERTEVTRAVARVRARGGGS